MALRQNSPSPGNIESAEGGESNWGASHRALGLLALLVHQDNKAVVVSRSAVYNRAFSVRETPYICWGCGVVLPRHSPDIQLLDPTLLAGTLVRCDVNNCPKGRSDDVSDLWPGLSKLCRAYGPALSPLAAIIPEEPAWLVESTYVMRAPSPFRFN